MHIQFCLADFDRLNIRLSFKTNIFPFFRSINSLILTRCRLLDHSLSSIMLLISYGDFRLFFEVFRVKSGRLLSPVTQVFLVLNDVSLRIINGLVIRIILITDHFHTSISEKEAGQMWSTLATSPILLL